MEVKNTTTSTKQVVDRDSNGQFAVGRKPSVGFHTHPENRSNGGWKKEDSIGYQYNKLIRMTVKEIKTWLQDNPDETRTLAQDMAYNAVLQARKDLAYLKEVTDRTEGKATQGIDHTSNGNTILVKGLEFLKE